MLLVALARAADVTVGGGIDLLNTIRFEPEPVDVFELREAEGDLMVAGETVTGRLDLDVHAVVFDGPVVFGVYGVSPEQATVRFHPGAFFAQAGVAPGPWRLEKVDAWDNDFAAWSMASRLLPGSILGGNVGLHSGGFTAQLVGGYAAPRFDLVHLGDLTAVSFGPVVGADVAYEIDAFTVRGGAWTRPTLGEALAGEVALGLNVGIVGASVEVVGNAGGAVGGHTAVALWPKGVVSPMARVEYLHGVGPGVGVGVGSMLFRVLRFKAEFDYQDRQPAAYLEASVASPWPRKPVPKKKEAT